MKIIGIYEILNKVNNKRYIGSSIDLLARKRQHFNKLKRGKHGNVHLQSAFNVYGGNNFEFIILEEFREDINDLGLRLEEQNYIDNYDWDCLYNLQKFVLSSYIKTQKYCNLNQWIYKRSENKYQVRCPKRCVNFKILNEAIKFRAENWEKFEGIIPFEEYSRKAHSEKVSRGGIKSGGNVSFSKIHQKWSVFIYIDRKPCSLGFYNTKEDGIKARIDAEKRYYEQKVPWTLEEANKYRTRKCTSDFKGVGFNKKASKWRARVNNKHIGFFPTELEAAKAIELYTSSKK